MGILKLFKHKKKDTDNKKTTYTDPEVEFNHELDMAFEEDIESLYERDDIETTEDACMAEFQKAIKLREERPENYDKRSINIMENLADRYSYAPAMVWLGNMEKTENKNFSAAISWYKKAVDYKDGQGARCYADMLMAGNGVRQDCQLAMHFYAIAADKCVPEAAFIFGKYFQKLNDHQHALLAYEQALALGYEPASIRIKQIKSECKDNYDELSVENENTGVLTMSSDEMLEAMMKINQVVGGAIEYISMAEITITHLNLMDAKQNLSADQLDDVKNKFEQYMRMTLQKPMDADDLHLACVQIFRDFDTAAPIRKYIPTDEPRVASIVEDIEKKQSGIRYCLSSDWLLEQEQEKEKEMISICRRSRRKYSPIFVTLDSPDDTTLEVWRDSDGKLNCPGDACPMDPCSNKCPISIATTAMMFFQMGQYQKAAETYSEATAIAPDFAEAYNNAAACYGSMRDYENAYQNYKKAYSLEHKKGALYGLAISCKDLGKLEEALGYCDEYDEKFGDGALDDARQQIMLKRSESESASDSNKANLSIELLTTYLAAGVKEGYLDDPHSFPNIPELMAQVGTVCASVFKSIYEYNEARGKRHDHTIIASARFCAYAGMGAVLAWHQDWNSLKSNGIYETLVAPRGIFAMDEYVSDSIGIPYGTDESKKLDGHFNSLALSAVKSLISKDAAFADSCIYVLHSMYLYGMVLEMHRLGMN